MKPQVSITNEHWSLNGLPLYIYSGDHVYFSPNEMTVTETDCGYAFEVNGKDEITLVVPCGNRKIIVGDDYDYLDSRGVFQYYCKGPTEILKHDKMDRIYIPMFHLIDDDVFSISVFGESIVSVFTREYEQYVSITGIPHESKIIFYLDVAANYKVNLQRHPLQRRTIEYVDCLDMPDIRSAIYHGAQLVCNDTNIEKVIDTAVELQSIFNDENLYSVITGTVAEALNGISCLINDYDFMFKNRPSVMHASEILKMNGWKVCGQDEKSISMQKDNELKVDLADDDYNILKFPVNIREANGLRFLDTQGLMWIALLNAQEFNRTLYKYPKNDKALFRLSLHANRTGLLSNTKIGAELLKSAQYTEKCKMMTDMISDCPVLFKDTRINHPFMINCFGFENARIFSIINTGSMADARIATDMKPDFAQWEDIGGRIREAKIEINDNFSLIYLTEVDLPGILRCSTMAK